MKGLKSYSVSLLTVILTFSIVSPAWAASQEEPTVVTQQPGKITLVDPQATAETRSLFAYLNDIRGKKILFGHQHATDEGITLKPDAAGVQSDVYNSVGEYPAVFGWDTLSLEGKEKPGVAGDLEQSRRNLVSSMKQAHEMGAILNLSTHFPNFVTGGSFNDTAGNVVEHILPGGDKNEDFNAFLDQIAVFAKDLKDDQGKQIPVLFRPFHEQNGGWFWWGSKTTTSSQYVALYRYTVEYLRDNKGVHNFLYVYSPNGPFGGKEDHYLTTYPGDLYVDVLGMDQYDNDAKPGTESFLNGLVSDLAMISRLADLTGKVSTFSEFGYSPSGMKASGNLDTEWFTKVLNAIKSNPDAKRMSYMLTWANFSTNGNLFVPYKNAPNGLGDHELLNDFVNYYRNDYTGFLKDVKGVYDYKVDTIAKEPFMHIAAPIEGSSVTRRTTKVLARVLDTKPTKVTFTASGLEKEQQMKLDSNGFYAADWTPPLELNGKTANIAVKVYQGNRVTLSQQIQVFVRVNEIPIKSYSFDHTKELNEIRNNGAYPNSVKTSFSRVQLKGNGMLKINVNGLDPSQTWQEFKMLLQDPSVDYKQVNRIKLKLLVPVNSTVDGASLRAVAMIPGQSETKYGQEETLKKVSSLGQAKINNTAYYEYEAVIDMKAPTSATEGLAVSIVGSGLKSGPVYVDQIQLYNAYYEASLDPAVVDDFESYGTGDSGNKILQSKYVRASSGDEVQVALSDDAKGGHQLKYTYNLSTQGYAGVTKVLSGVDWSAFNQLQMQFTPDGQGQKLVIQLKMDGKLFEYYPKTTNTEPHLERMPFNEFVPVHGTQGSITKDRLKSVTEFSIYTNAVDGAKLTSTMYFDEIKAVLDPTVSLIN